MSPGPERPVRLEVHAREPFAGGHRFPGTAAYEVLTARYTVDPKAATNRPRTLADAGSGYLMRRGYTIVFGAWQGDLLPGDDRLLLNLPVAKRGAEPVRGLTTAEFIVEEPTASLPLSRRSSIRSYPVSERAAHTVRLTRRR
ncbi:hypothetical protein ABZV34_25040 [Streptomyces sp. NPDC005195]|uniref:hypothetical protein n=1 Tax=Streptomyces sp. NPDC005195 TaxID=3154561 RepID=UPI0033A4AB10